MIKPPLKAPGTERLKVKCDELLPIVAFNLNLRCYIKVPRKGSIYSVNEGNARWWDAGMAAGAHTRQLLSST
jgi:hypothetical protein